MSYKRDCGEYNLHKWLAETVVQRCFPSGLSDVQWTSIEPPYRTSGRPKGTFNGRLVDVPNETQLVRPNRTKMDVHCRPSRDAMHGTWTSSGPPPDVYGTPTRCHT